MPQYASAHHLCRQQAAYPYQAVSEAVAFLCCSCCCTPQAKLLSRLLDAANGMAYLHARGIMHVS